MTDELVDDVGEEEDLADASKRILGTYPKGIAHSQLQSELRRDPAVRGTAG